MIDISTNKPLYVSTDGDSVPYIMVAVEQLDDVRGLLSSNNIPYWVDEDAISLDGKPAVTVINLARSADASHVQHILDSAA